MKTNTSQYHARFQQVLDYINAHLEGDLSLQVLSEVAAFSRYHFHRQFSELYGISVYKYVQLCRLKKASYQLAFREQQPVIDIALASGYEGPEAFSRAFKKNIGQTPTEFRRRPQWQPWYASHQSLSEIRSKHMNSRNEKAQVEIVDFRQTQLAVLEHRGDPKLIGDSIRRFIDWRKANGLSPANSDTYNILYQHPDEVAPEDFHMDIAVSTDVVHGDNDIGIVSKTLPAGRCAVLRHTGSDDLLEQSIHYLYAEWLPQSGEELRDFPIYMQRVKFYPDVSENETVTDIFLPIV